MGLHLSLRVVLFLIIFAQNITVFAQKNVTIDDGDPSITYSPPVGNSSTTGWTQSTGNSLDYLNTLTFTQNLNATASFNFTGIAIYFLSPLWPYRVTTFLSLDSAPHTTIDLQDYSSPVTDGGNQTIPSQIVWKSLGLANTQHNLLMSIAPNEKLAIVDALMYTTAPATNDTSSSSLLPTPTSHDPIVASSTAVTSSPKSKSKSVVAIALGSLFGIFGLFVIVGGVWYFFRRRKRPRLEGWTIDDDDATSMLRNISTSGVGPNATNNTENRSAEPAHDSRSSTSQLSYTTTTDYYELTHILSTTERSMPQMAEGTPLLATAPPPYESEAEYYTAAQVSEARHGGSRIQQQQPLHLSLVGADSPSEIYPSKQ